ncbi:UNVERIFIED_CONTAM: hypothetical protein Sangu_0248800 [Sesamum angustifolium]|uniref:Rhodopsin n=1 Tax=Sesamum angustifolium TaxID=2727405 RepID=A0AAW2RNL3_9LAMI
MSYHQENYPPPGYGTAYPPPAGHPSAPPSGFPYPPPPGPAGGYQGYFSGGYPPPPPPPPPQVYHHYDHHHHHDDHSGCTSFLRGWYDEIFLVSFTYLCLDNVLISASSNTGQICLSLSRGSL